jgi:phage minor structural protein
MWCIVEINHNEDGTVVGKNIYFKKTIGIHKEIPVIKYGFNLKSIKRTIDSDRISTKLIVKNNSNEFANNGFCSIARAQLNPTGENFVLNFDYYVNKKMISQERLYEHLYSNLVKIGLLKTEAGLDDTIWPLD